MRLCKKCGGQSPDNSKFCQNCGAPFESSRFLGDMGKKMSSTQNDGQHASVSRGENAASGDPGQRSMPFGGNTDTTTVRQMPYASQNTDNAPADDGQHSMPYASQNSGNISDTDVQHTEPFNPADQNRTAPSPDMQNTSPVGSYTGKAPKPGYTGKHMAIAFVTVIIVTMISIVGGKLIGSYMEESKYSDINKAIERKENYVPGNFDGFTYSSKHLDIRMDFGYDWENGSAEDYEKMTDEFASIMSDNFSKSIRSSGVDDEKGIAKFEESIYTQTEAIAYLKKGGDYVGEFYINVFGWYGVEEISIDDYKSEMTKSKIVCSDIDIAGKEAMKARVKETDGVHRSVYIFKENDFVVMVIAVYADEYEDEVCGVIENAERY